LHALAKDQQQQQQMQQQQQQQTNVGITGHTSQQIRSVNQQPLYTAKAPPPEPFQTLLDKKVKDQAEQLGTKVLLTN
jgi:hypothetical protein